MSDSSLKQAVLDELEWDPSVNAAHIGVTANNGVVTLTGDVGSYTEKLAADSAAWRVFGVKAVADELVVRYPSGKKIEDADIAQKALQVLSWDSEVPLNKVKVEVEKGWVTLSGEVDRFYQRNAAEEDVQMLQGVAGVTNNINIKPRVQPSASDVRSKIKAALQRNAQIEADDITVKADGGKVTLYGNVDTWYEDEEVVNAAWPAPGVSQGVDRIVVGNVS